MSLTVSSLDSSSISTLFSGFSSGISGGGSSPGGSTILADYYSIRNGSYYKLMKAYYGNTNSGTTNSTNNTTDKVTDKEDTSSTLNQLQSDAVELKKNTDVLLKKGTDSVFDKVTTEDAEGKVTSGYDTDAISKAVGSFVDSYNQMLSSAGKSNTTGVLTSVAGMTRSTASNAALLGKLGISISEDHTLSFDLSTFKKADMSLARSLFHATGSYGYQIASNASMVKYYAANEASAANSYTRGGSYAMMDANSVFSSYI